MFLAISLALASRSCSQNFSRPGSSLFFFFFFFFFGCSVSSSGTPGGSAAGVCPPVSSGFAEELPGRAPSSGLSGTWDGNLLFCFVFALLLFLSFRWHNRLISGWEFRDLIIIVGMAVLLSLLGSHGSRI